MSADLLSAVPDPLAMAMHATAARLSRQPVGIYSSGALPLDRGNETYFRPGLAADLLSSWLPSLENVITRLHTGATVAELQCRGGTRSVLLAQAFTNSHFHGFDSDPTCVAAARRAAAEAGLAHRTTFFEASPAHFNAPKTGYDLLIMIDGIPDTSAALQNMRTSIKKEGTLLLADSPPKIAHLQTVLPAAGFKLVRITPQNPTHHLLEAR